VFRALGIPRDEKQLGRIAQQMALLHGHAKDLAKIPPQMRHDAVREPRLRLRVEQVLQFVTVKAAECFLPVKRCQMHRSRSSLVIFVESFHFLL